VGSSPGVWGSPVEELKAVRFMLVNSYGLLFLVYESRRGRVQSFAVVESRRRRNPVAVCTKFIFHGPTES